MKPRRYVIPVFVPHVGCPNKCVFCNQRRISGAVSPATPETVAEAIEAAKSKIPEVACAELAFYGGSFTAIPPAAQEKLLGAASPLLSSGVIKSVRLSTRPDCIDKETLARLKSFGVKTVELGAQSMCGDVLEKSNRGHTAEDTVRAAELVKGAGFELILQMMTGLPGDTREKSLYTAQRIAELKPDGVRIYPTVIIRDTELYDMWRSGEYREHTVEEAVSLCAELVPVFESAGIPVIRLGLNPTEELSGGEAAAGAYHPAFGELVYSKIYLDRAEKLLCGVPEGASVLLGVAHGKTSVMTGQKRSNLNALIQKFGLKSVKVMETEFKPGEIAVLSVEK